MTTGRPVSFQEARVIVSQSLPQRVTPTLDGWQDSAYWKVNVQPAGKGGPTYLVRKATGELVLAPEYLPGTPLAVLVDAMVPAM